jgi:hypothetical protein
MLENEVVCGGFQIILKKIRNKMTNSIIRTPRGFIPCEFNPKVEGKEEASGLIVAYGWDEDAKKMQYSIFVASDYQDFRKTLFGIQGIKQAANKKDQIFDVYRSVFGLDHNFCEKITGELNSHINQYWETRGCEHFEGLNPSVPLKIRERLDELIFSEAERTRLKEKGLDSLGIV